ncbi:DUF411 domain-containing protein [Halopelagius longus]|uniref:Uncharacterized conserved protein n=1 Tax=Halopelagius longus TaxID=1236180 RepID=A0A1H0XNP9_9EURY|nr:DUF411 domain-containing protein [Halopelagius longus]RDI71968.1 hypothetical protein DWB78_09680 [Halopelagius longus]SDQ04522.1 Uncharacterized conserved protein [Halopelagius longus]
MNQKTPGQSDDSGSPETARFSRRTFLSAAGVTGIGALAGCLGGSDSTANFGTGDDAKRLREAAASYLDTATLYKAPNCSCCREYTEYLETATDVSVEVVEVSDLAKTKEKYNVPRDVESCHTMDIGDYYVEGHVPLEAIGKLAEEKPDIAGIALPGMPRGSPGMPGEKAEEFVISAASEDGTYREFVRI